MPLTLRAAAVAIGLLAVGAPPVAAQSAAPATLAGTDLSSSSATVTAARCSRSGGFAAFSATGVAANGAYVGPFHEDAAGRLGPGGLAGEPRTLLADDHVFSIESPPISPDDPTPPPPFKVFGTQQAVDEIDAALCAKPYTETTSLYLSSFPSTRYAARIETEGAVYVDRGEGFVEVDITVTNGEPTARTRTFFETSTEEVPQLLRRRDCRRGRFAELAYSTKAECRRAADAS